MPDFRVGEGAGHARVRIDARGGMTPDGRRQRARAKTKRAKKARA